MADNLIYQTEITQLATQEAASTATANTSTLDMQDYDGVVFLGRYKTAATGNRVRVQMATATGGTFTLLATTEQNNITDFRVDIYRPTERYLRLKYTRGSVAFGDTWAIQYQGRNLSSSTQTFGFHASPTT